MNKREVVLSLIDSSSHTPYYPAGFFLHFDKNFHRGRAAIDKHLEYFHFTGMDFVKIQYELTFPYNPSITKPDEWANIPKYNDEFFRDQWQIAKGLVESAGSDALVIMTLYSPYMCASQFADKEVLDRHINDYPEKITKGMEIITESLTTFVDGCIQHGIDGFYHSTQGAETHRFGGSSLFQECIKPFDLALMNHVNNRSQFNIFHICDYHGGYDDLSVFQAYPGDIVNCSLRIGDQNLTGKEISEMFQRPFMGGMDRHGILVTGSNADIQSEVENLILNSPDKFLLGADCTLPSDINWENIRTAINIAHQYPLR